MQTSVVHGVLERSVSEQDLLAALADVAVNFDESPQRMICALGPAGLGVRWFTFACTSIGGDMALAERHFTEIMVDHVEELVVVARSQWSSTSAPPTRFEYYRDGAGALTLRLDADSNEVCVLGALPDGARRDGSVDQIGLEALGVPWSEPFEAVRAPREAVVLRENRKVQRALRIAALDGPVPPVRALPDVAASDSAPTSGLRFAHVARRVGGGGGDVRALVDRTLRDAEREHLQIYETRVLERARLLADAGPAVVPLLVERLAAPKVNPRVAALAIVTLGALGGADAARAVLPWTARDSEALRDAVVAAYVAMGEAARAALEEGARSRKGKQRALCEALLATLDAPAWEPLRRVRAARDGVPADERAELRALATTGWYHPDHKTHRRRREQRVREGGPAAVACMVRAVLEQHEGDPAEVFALLEALGADPLGPWVLALAILESPMRSGHADNRLSRKTLARVGEGLYGRAFAPVASRLRSLTEPGAKAPPRKR